MSKNDYDLYGFDKMGYNRYTGTKYDSFGYDINGYNKDGYGRNSYDIDGYDRSGYDRYGYGRDGYNKSGYDKLGYDKNGCNKAGIYHRETQSWFDLEGYNKDGYNKNIGDRDGHDKNEYNKDGYDKSGFDCDGYDKEGFHRNDYDTDGQIQNLIVRTSVSKSVDKITYKFDEKKVTTYNKNGYIISHWNISYKIFMEYVNATSHYNFRRKYFGDLKASRNLILSKKNPEGKYIIPNYVIRPTAEETSIRMSIVNSAGLSYAIFYTLGARSCKLSRYSFEEIEKILDNFNFMNGSSIPTLSNLWDCTMKNLEKRLTEYGVESTTREAASYTGGRLRSYSQIYDAVWIRQISPDLCELLV